MSADYKQIIMYLPSMQVGGGNRILLEFGERLVQDKFKVSLAFCDYGKQNFKSAGNLNIISTSPKVKSKFLKFIFGHIELILKIRSNKEALCIVSDPILSIFSFFLCPKRVIRFVQSDDENLFNDRFPSLINYLYKFLFFLSKKYSYRQVIFNSPFSMQKYDAQLSIDKEKIIFPFISEGLKSEFYQEKDYPDKPVVTCLYRPKHPRKGGIFLRNFYFKYQNKYLFQFITPSNEKTADDVNMHLISPKNDKELKDILRSSHFVVNASIFEGFGLFLFEGMSNGCIPLSVEFEALKDLNHNKIISIINSEEDLDRQISSFYQNKTEIARLSKECFEFSKKFNIESFYSSFRKYI